MKKIILLLTTFILFNSSFSQNNRTSAITEVISGTTSSAAGAAPFGQTRYQRVCYLVLGTEMTAAGIANNSALTSLGFQYLVPHDVTTTGSFKVYMQNTTDASFTKSTTWDGAGGTIDGMTLVSNSTITLTSGAEFIDHTFSGGSAFSWTTNNLYIAFEYQYPSGTLATVGTAYANSTAVGGSNGLRRATSTTTLPTTLSTSSAFRPLTRIGYNSGIANDANVTTVYALGKAPIPASNPNTISASVKNSGDNTLTNVTVTLNISGANTYTNSKTITSLAPGISTIVTFDAATFTNAGTNTILVSVPSDGNNANNEKGVSQVVNWNTFSHIYGSTSDGGVGNSSAIEFVQKFTTASTASIDQITVSFNNVTTPQPFTVTVRDASGTGGLPGTTPLYESSSQNSATGAVIVPITATSVSGTFYIGVKQTTATNFGVSYQVETPIRQNICYTAASPFTSFSSTTYKIFIDARFASTLPISLTSFTGSKVGTINKLVWNTAGEQNNKGFELQRSADGVNFSSLEFVNSKATNGNSTSNLNYVFNDEKPLKGTSYYRLKQVDNDGKSSLSNVVVINGNKVATIELSNLYPNPVKDKLNLIISNEANRKVDLIVTDLSGKIVLTQSQTVSIGDSNIQLNVEKLASGSYILKAVCNDGCESSLRKFVKQ